MAFATAPALAQPTSSLGEALRRLEATLRAHLAAEALPPLPPAPPALARIAAAFGLTSFERQLLLLGAAVELDARVATLVGEATGEPGPGQPTFSLALAVLPGAHWSALAPDAPLRSWRLLTPGGGGGLAYRPLQIDEQILHLLMGCDGPPRELAPLLTVLEADADLPPSQQAIARRLADVWSGGAAQPPLALLSGADLATQRAMLATAADLLGQPAAALDMRLLPVEPEAVAKLALLCSREARLGRGALLLEAGEAVAADPERAAALGYLAERVEGLVAVNGAPPLVARTAIRLEIRRPEPAEQRALWREALGQHATPETVERAAETFCLSAAEVRAACAAAPGGDPGALWAAARARVRPQLEGLARLIEPRARWDSLVLPEDIERSLRTIVAAVRRRTLVHERWGFNAHGERGLGTCALFAGASGTGKTSAAELIAAELQFDLYQIDLSQVVSKYIGETEKQLRRIFDAAEAGGAVLLFDEADALFGKRSEVKDSRDRYANLEVSYLLQRIEQYRGLAILTTNAKQALDSAFLRRLRFVVQFPFPDAAQREQIWRRAFPAAAPLAELDYARLARLNLAGGNISSIALSAAYLAAEAGTSITMQHLADAARAELAKLERPESEAEIIADSR